MNNQTDQKYQWIGSVLVNDKGQNGDRDQAATIFLSLCSLLKLSSHCNYLGYLREQKMSNSGEGTTTTTTNKGENANIGKTTFIQDNLL